MGNKNHKELISQEKIRDFKHSIMYCRNQCCSNDKGGTLLSVEQFLEKIRDTAKCIYLSRCNPSGGLYKNDSMVSVFYLLESGLVQKLECQSSSNPLSPAPDNKTIMSG